MAADLLPYPEELAISDVLSERARVLDAYGLRLIDPLPPQMLPEDLAVVLKGRLAAERLVAAYDPYAWSLARQVQRDNRGDVLDRDDLYQIASETMVKATLRFDARGAARTPCQDPACAARHTLLCPSVPTPQNPPSLLASLTMRRPRRAARPRSENTPDLCAVFHDGGWRCVHQRCSHERVGRRFSTYCGPYVLRELGNAVHKSSIAFTLPPARIRNTWHWNEELENLRQVLGRYPSDEEMSLATGLSPEDIEPDLPSRLSMVDVNGSSWGEGSDSECGYEQPGAQPDLSETPQAEEGLVLPELADLTDAASIEALTAALSMSMEEDQVRVFMSLIGADLGVPRSTREVAEHLKMPRQRVASIESAVFEGVRHPRTRAQAVIHLRALGVIST